MNQEEEKGTMNFKFKYKGGIKVNWEKLKRVNN
jgi:hypothetical protein